MDTNDILDKNRQNTKKCQLILKIIEKTKIAKNCLKTTEKRGKSKAKFRGKNKPDKCSTGNDKTSAFLQFFLKP
jgi:hypothetical protein